MRRKLMLLVFAIMLMVGLLALPSAPVVQAATCKWTTATWAGQRGWDSWYNPNYMVDFKVNVAGISYAIYYRGVLIGPSSIVNVRDYYQSTNTTAFGVSTRWATLNPGWRTASNWTMYYCS